MRQPPDKHSSIHSLSFLLREVGRHDETTKGGRFGMSHSSARDDSVKGISKIMNRSLPAQFAQIRVEIVDPAAVSDLSRFVDHHRLGRHGRFSLFCDLPRSIGYCGDVAIAKLLKVRSHCG